MEAGIGAGVGLGAGLDLGVESLVRGGRGEVGVPSSLILESFFSGLVGFSDLAFPESGREEGRGVMVVSRILGAGRLGVGVADEVGGGRTAAFSLARRRRSRFCSISSFFCSSSSRSEGWALRIR